MNNVVSVSLRRWLRTIENNKAPRLRATLVCLAFVGLESCSGRPDTDEFRQELSSIEACIDLVKRGLRAVPDDRAARFLGKVQEDTAECRGGTAALEKVENDPDPWVDWSRYWATADRDSRFAYDERWA